MATRPIEQEYVLLDFEVMDEEFDQIFHFFDIVEIGDEEAESRPTETARWGYRIPCPGVRCYSFE